MGWKTEESGGKWSSLDSSGGGRCGISRRHGVILALVTYAVITALLLGRAYRNKDGENNSPPLLVHLPEKMSSNVLPEESLEEGLRFSKRDPVVAENRSSSSSLGSTSRSNNMEDPDEEEGWRDSLYHSSVVFGLGYEEMLSSFKIFVYPVNDHAFSALSTLGQEDSRFTDDFFFRLLCRSDFVTLDPEKADVYFIPLSIRSLWNDELVGASKIGRFLNKYVQRIRDDYPYWHRTLGADHAIVVCNDYKEDGSRNGLELKKNVIQVSCSPLTGAQTFFPHKDFAIPPLQTTNSLEILDLVESIQRTKLVYHFGKDSGRLTRVWEGDDNFLLVNENVAIDTHQKNLASSQYCLILMPEDTGNVFDAMKFGCVPVLVSDGRMYDLPFQDVLNWDQFTVIVSSRKLSKLKSYLQHLSQDQYQRKKILAMDASRHLEWHDPPKDQDAFYMTIRRQQSPNAIICDLRSRVKSPS
ncbi:hypothetical protein R1sor_018122 [Riccia sorocarpa]|uniref:Exostosin GT47 domain-containing protein n=1 Tax=Riccia sorocarpa TaxID=122646 RepID=A0ABD3ICI8_9MARC